MKVIVDLLRQSLKVVISLGPPFQNRTFQAVDAGGLEFEDIVLEWLGLFGDLDGGVNLGRSGLQIKIV